MYINGTEVARSNMPAGTITTNTFAASQLDGADEATFFPFTVPPGVLVAGTNTIAVEVHQNSRASSDLSFDLALDAEVSSGGGDTTAPTAPSALTLGTVTANSVALSWGASTDDFGVDHYTVLRNGAPVGTTTRDELHRQRPSPTAAPTRTRSSRSTRRTTLRPHRTRSSANTPDVTPPIDARHARPRRA